MNPGTSNTASTVVLSPADESAIRQLLLRMQQAWESGDGQGYASVFSEDARYVNAPGERLVGRQAIAESHQRIFDTFFKDTRLGSTYPLELQLLTADTVLVYGSGAVLFRGESETNVAPNGLMTLVVVKRNAEWQCASFCNTPSGALRNLRFFWRYFLSKLRQFRAEWSKARVYMLQKKQANIARWKSRL